MKIPFSLGKNLKKTALPHVQVYLLKPTVDFRPGVRRSSNGSSLSPTPSLPSSPSPWSSPSREDGHARVRSNEHMECSSGESHMASRISSSGSYACIIRFESRLVCLVCLGKCRKADWFPSHHSEQQTIYPVIYSSIHFSIYVSIHWPSLIQKHTEKTR